jgi:hypothetical protein
MTPYKRIRERVRRPVAAVCFLLGTALLAEAIWLERGVMAYMVIVPILVGSCVAWLVPSGGSHPPSESTLQWARKQRRERSE